MASSLLQVPKRFQGLPSSPRAVRRDNDSSSVPATPTSLPYFSSQEPESSSQPTFNEAQTREAYYFAHFAPASVKRQTSNSSTVSSTSTVASTASSVSTKAASISSITKLNEKYAISPDPSYWKMYQEYDLEEGDDWLHNPNPKRDARSGSIFTRRGFANLTCLILVIVAIVGLFTAYPILEFFLAPSPRLTDSSGFSYANSTGQATSFFGRTGLIDNDTPMEARTISSYTTGETWQLVFSDEFNTEGRTFYPGDDPYWEAVDLYYHETQDLEWYDPQQVTTVAGSLRIWFNQTQNHDLNFMGGMVQSWNKFCFTGGMVLASVSLPGSPKLSGLWPAVWTMGNLGRAGYGASLEGMWPYQGYNECDVGTLANQTEPGSNVVPTDGDPNNGGLLSFLPGQRLSRCTCKDDTSHPGPKNDDGTWFGRSSPEIDIFEATVSSDGGRVSQSSQWGPFDDGYQWNTNGATLYNTSASSINNFKGNAFQESTSVLTFNDQTAYTQLADSDEDRVFSTYGYEYQPGFDGGYISWISNGALSWTLDSTAVGPNTVTNISQRGVSNEPMYIIMNLGMSTSFQTISPELLLPAHMDIDWIRVYQPPDQINVGCDPDSMPTLQYINDHIDAYTNPNLTVFSDIGASFPGNRLLGQCPNEDD